MSTMQQFKILGDCGILLPRCTGCCEELPLTSPVEVYETQGSIWVVVECKKCGRCSPFPMQKGAAIQ